MPKPPAQDAKAQLGVRIDPDLAVEIKVLAARQRKRVNELVEEALRDVLRKYGKASQPARPKGK